MTRLTHSNPPVKLFAVASLVLVGALSTLPEVSAQPSPPDASKPANPSDEDPNKERAREYYINGLRLHKEGAYREAASSYLSAYQLYPRPAFLYNAAQVFRLAGESKKALQHYKKYIELEPDGDGAANAREFIARLEAQLGRSNGVPASNGSVTGVTHPFESNTAVKAGNAAVKAGNATEASVPENSAPILLVSRDAIAGRGRAKRVVGIVLVGVGVGVLGAGIGFGVHARSLSDQAANFTGPVGPGLEGLYDRGRIADRNMVVLLSAGALTAVTGSIVYYLGIRDRNRAERDLELFIAPTSVAIGGRF